MHTHIVSMYNKLVVLQMHIYIAHNIALNIINTHKHTPVTYVASHSVVVRKFILIQRSVLRFTLMHT